VVFTRLEPGRTDVRFDSMSGPLSVKADGELLVLDFPSRPAERIEAREDVARALGRAPLELWAARDYLAVFAREDEVRGLSPDMGLLRRLEKKAVIATAPGSGGVDFVSRFFAPALGIDEDPVTGSSHTNLTPYWSKRLGKKRLQARQVSARGGELRVDDLGERVAIAGRVAAYLEGTIHI
jgi:predicted PhzF superfamily epimerase YddE/YHI9